MKTSQLKYTCRHTHAPAHAHRRPAYLVKFRSAKETIQTEARWQKKHVYNEIKWVMEYRHPFAIRRCYVPYQF